MHANAWWFLGIAFVSAIGLVLMIVRAKNRRNVFLLYLIMVGFGYLVEFFIYILLGSYQYYPRIMHKDSYFDSNLGAIASNSLSLPVTAIAVATYRLSWLPIGGFVLLFAGVEELFLHLGIYKHNWWHTWFTSVGLPFYYGMAKLWSGWLLEPLHGLRKALLLYFIIGTITSNFQVMGFMILKTRSYHIGWFTDPERDATAFAAVYYLCVSLLFTMVLMLRSGHERLKFALTMTVILTVSLTLKAVGITHVHVWWDLPFMFLACSLALWLSGLAGASLSHERRAW